MTKKNLLNPLSTEQWDKSLKPIIDDMNGRPINVHKLMAHNPGLLQAWWDFRNYSVGGGQLGKRLGELVILRVAVHMKAWYEWGSHVERGLDCGLTLSEIESVKNKPSAEDWTENEWLLLLAVDELIQQQAISPPLLEKLHRHFTDAQIMDIMAIQGMYITLACMINTWGLALDEHVQEKLPSHVTQTAFESEFPR